MKGMKYHDYIWDLGGTLLDNYETSTAAFVETLALYGITQDHDSVYQALKVSTPFAIETFAPILSLVIGRLISKQVKLQDLIPTCLPVS